MIWRLGRWLPFAGVLTALLVLAGGFVIESGDTPEGDDATAADYAAYFADDESSILLGSVLLLLGVFFLFFFLGALRRHLLASGAEDTLAAIAFGAGIAAAVCMVGVVAPSMGGAFTDDDVLEPAAAVVFWTAGDGFFVGAGYALAALFVATGLASVARRGFPPWFGWVSFLFALVLLIPPVGWAVLIFGMPLWLIVAAILMYMRAPDRAVGEPAPATTPVV